jgi:uncharacterized phage protein (TIGR01671 family)
MKNYLFRAYLPKGYKGLIEAQMLDVDQLSIFKDGSVEIFVDGSYIRIPSEFVVLMQSIGRKDTNGKDIFDGDFVLVKGDIAEVRWIKDGWRMVKREAGFEIDMAMHVFSGKELKVIGNIHENTLEELNAA